MSKSCLIYGANGYTGELVAHRAVECGLSPVLAGRNGPAVAKLADTLGLEYRVVSLDSPAELDNVLTGHTLVLNCAGPFARTSQPVVDACLHTGAHYLDITGEIAVFERLHRQDAAARDAGIMLLPGTGFDVVPSDCLATHLKRRLPSATRLTLAFRSLSQASRGTATTAIEHIQSGGAIRRAGKIVAVPAAHATRTIDFGRGPVEAVAIPWGDVSTAYYSTGIPNIEVYMALPQSMIRLMGIGRHIGWVLGLPIVRQALLGVVRRQPPGPSAELRARGLSLLWGEVTDADGGRAISRLRTPEAYQLTAITMVMIAQRVLAGDLRPGFQTPASAYGPDLIMDVDGVVREDIT